MFKLFDFGRLFFPNDNEKSIPDVILFQPLGNHVGNVRKLVKKWDLSQENHLSYQRISEAAGLHDIGKPQKFSPKVEFKKGKPQLGYSFSGHRFLAECSQNPWVEKLARGHHDYSIHDICRDTYTLKNLVNEVDSNHYLWEIAKTYSQSLASDSFSYAKELYILEMCDQIEAEIACRFYEGKNSDQAESRAFMDFNIVKENDNLFLLEPWPFKGKGKEVRLTLATWSMKIPQELKNKIQKSSENDAKNLEKQLKLVIKDWCSQQSKTYSIAKTNQVILKPLLTENQQEFNAHQLYQDLRKFTPNPMQEDLISKLNNPNPVCVLKAPTGTGKLEAVLIPSLAYNRKLILVLPTKSLLEDHRQRIDSYLKNFSALSANKDRDIALVIDTGTQMTRYIYQNGLMRLPENNPRRHLYKGNIILTTLDKFMYRYFAFGDKQKSFIFPYRIHQDNSLICFDEAHSYDDISFTNFCSLVKALYEAGRSLVLMTATLSENHLQKLDYLSDDLIDYIDNLSNLEKLTNFQLSTLKQTFSNQKKFEWIQDILYDNQSPEKFQNQFAEKILDEWEQNPKQKIIASVETVKDAVAIYSEIKNKIGSQNDQGRFLFLYHGRISDIPKSSEFSRTKVYQQIKEKDENNQAYILVTTSAIEVGCDLNSNQLITQLCNPESLIQRAGRCNRKGNIQNAKITVIGNNIPDFISKLSESDFKAYQTTLQNMNGANFDSKKIMQCVSTQQKIDDYRVIELFSSLYDYVYNADLVCQPAHEKGLVITRSWTPSVTLVYDDGNSDDEISKMPQITVPIDRLIIKKDSENSKSNQYENVHVYERLYKQEETRWVLEPLKYWGQAYQKNLVVKIHQSYEGATFDSYEPYPYDEELGFVDLPGVFIKWSPKGNEERLQYKTTEDKSVVITYVKALIEN